MLLPTVLPFKSTCPPVTVTARRPNGLFLIKFGVVNVRVVLPELVGAADNAIVKLELVGLLIVLRSETLATVVPSGIPIPETDWPAITAELIELNKAEVLPAVN